ncbi:hypothetical protein HanIR_Chr13g0630491 [Helianthus annuus]|nr:hypothetical protein HanIR_Chr13g0630491 [Helianthus annuus]
MGKDVPLTCKCRRFESIIFAFYFFVKILHLTPLSFNYYFFSIFNSIYVTTFVERDEFMVDMALNRAALCLLRANPLAVMISGFVFSAGCMLKYVSQVCILSTVVFNSKSHKVAK